MYIIRKFCILSRTASLCFFFLTVFRRKYAYRRHREVEIDESFRKAHFTRISGTLMQHISNHAKLVIETSAKKYVSNVAYDGFFFTLLYNWRHISKKNNIVMLVELIKILSEMKRADCKNLQLFESITRFLNFILVSDSSWLDKVEDMVDKRESIVKAWRSAGNFIYVGSKRSFDQKLDDNIFANLMSSFERIKDLVRVLSVLSRLGELGFDTRPINANFSFALSCLTPHIIEKCSIRDMINILYYIGRVNNDHIGDIENLLSAIDHRLNCELAPLTLTDCDRLLQTMTCYSLKTGSKFGFSSLSLSVLINLDCLFNKVKILRHIGRNDKVYLKLSSQNNSENNVNLKSSTGKQPQNCEYCTECKKSSTNLFTDIELVQGICMDLYGSYDFVHEFLDRHKIYCRKQNDIAKPNLYKWNRIHSNIEMVSPYLGKETLPYATILEQRISQDRVQIT
ncbi:conserved hypothetical protein [Theileria equi strain WA]|uniref:Uncharacterized protein n=1 Tax=Theileria equi strain WA TaxID=1537102 RepID=L1LG10_THEEQ|nr:conserved hypothetical protein [Theileria equi strain WA]EKX74200.1 conserved hypothetical protein [Theileria equi strain WA]|eukprot:XP_004833652.1 conserved hypothetical protein [Theileria equi strain WA]